MRSWVTAVLVGPVLGLSVALWFVTVDAMSQRAEIERLEDENITLRVEVDSLRRRELRRSLPVDLIPPQQLPTGEAK